MYTSVDIRITNIGLIISATSAWSEKVLLNKSNRLRRTMKMNLDNGTLKVFKLEN